jgi:hypothetical protein
MSLQNSQEIADVKIFIAKGADGVGIEKIEKTATAGLVDTYTITYTDGNISTFEVANGSGGSADTTTYDPTVSGLASDTVQGAIDEVAGELSVAQTDISNLDDVKIDTDSGTFTDASSNTYTGQTVDMISYDNTNNQLLMKVNGADTVIPFSGLSKPELLWTNPNPTSSFAAQTVALDLSPYKSVCIEYVQNPTSSAKCYPKAFYAVGDTVSIPGSGATQQGFIGGAYGKSGSVYGTARDLTITSTGIVFGTGYAQNGAGPGYGVPQRIWGIKAQIYPDNA